jgi:hypothetical protein
MSSLSAHEVVDDEENTQVDHSDDPELGTPSLSVVIATREPASHLTWILDAVVPQLDEVNGEVLVACGDGTAGPPRQRVRYLTARDPNMLRLRRRAIEQSRGSVVAISEDHSTPAPGWARAVLRAHREHADAPAVAGCLVNATPHTVAGRVNFLGFAAPFVPPMTTIDRPPPVSALSFKREVLLGHGENPGSIESDLVPRLFADGAIAVDDRIVLDHFQDKGLWWSLVNAYVNTRTNYGYSRSLGAQPRREVLHWVVTRLWLRQWREAWSSRWAFRRQADVVFTAAICAATTFGAVVGVLIGPGRAAELVA